MILRITTSRRIRRAWLLKHHTTDIDDYARVVGFTGKDLWRRIQNSKNKYIVDNHFPWERYLGRRKHFHDAFILGTTRLNEQAQLIRLYEYPDGRKKIGKNFFVFGRHEELWTIRRLDEWALSTFDRNKLKSIGNLDSPASRVSVASPRAVAREVAMLLGEIRRQLIHVLGRGKAPGRRRKPESTDQVLYVDIRSKCGSCFANMYSSIEVARRAFALLLINSEKARQNFRKKGPSNGFQDAGLVANALFFRAAILSEDEGVGQMARYCEVKPYRRLA